MGADLPARIPDGFDLGVLFETWHRYSTYGSLDDEMRAIAKGTKAMSFFAFPDAEIDSDELYLEVSNNASKLNLLTIRKKALDPDYEGPIPHTYLFVIRDEGEAWRIPALLLAMKVGRSGAIDELTGRLLGYADEEAQRWREDRSRFHVNWKGSTVLFLMSSMQAASVRALAGRAIDPRAIVSPLTAFYSLRGNVIRRDASNRVPLNHELVRASLDQTFVQILFPSELIEDPTVELAVCNISQSQGASLNSALRSNFQFLGPDGWRSAMVDS